MVAVSLKWNANLEAAAEEVASKLVHSGCDAAVDSSKPGESVHVTHTADALHACGTVFWAWAGTAHRLNLEAKALYSANLAAIPGATPFLNAAWASTTHVGCSMVQAAGSSCMVVVCKYLPAVVMSDFAFGANIAGYSHKVPASDPEADGDLLLVVPRGSLHVLTRSPKMCVQTAPDVKLSDPVPLQQAPCEMDETEVFTADRLGGGEYRIQDLQGRCWTVADGATSVGTPVIVEPCGRDSAQVFVTKSTPTLTGWFGIRPVHGMPNMCVQLHDGSVKEGAPLVLGLCTNPPATGAHDFRFTVVHSMQRRRQAAARRMLHRRGYAL